MGHAQRAISSIIYNAIMPTCFMSYTTAFYKSRFVKRTLISDLTFLFNYLETKAGNQPA